MADFVLSCWLMGFSYGIKRNGRSRQVRIAVHGDGSVVVSAPKRLGDEYIARVVTAKKAWIENAIAKYQKQTTGLSLASESVDRRAFMAKVETMVSDRHRDVSAPYGAILRKIAVRKMRSRWGSCSRQGNVSINLLLGHLPDQLLEYVVIHELCHLVHLNHSKRFWALVATHLPDHKERKKELHRFGYLLKAAVPVRATPIYMVK